LEEIVVQNRTLISYFGYETLHSHIKHNNRWLTVRIISFSNILARIINNFKPYSFRAQKRITYYGNFPRGFHFESESGFKKLNKYYIGDYFGRMIGFLWMIFLAFTLAHIIYSVYLMTNLPIPKYLYIIILIINIVVFIWFIYKSILYYRYLKELRFRPFSIDAWYDMFRLATIQLEQKKDSI
jgi:hypothetical protein